MRRRPAALTFHRLSPLQALVDFVLAAGAYWLGFKLRVDGGGVFGSYAALFDHTWPIAGLATVLAVWVLGGYHRPWQHTDGRDDFRIAQGVVLGLLLLYAANAALHPVTRNAPEVLDSGRTVFREATVNPPLGVIGIAGIAGILLLVGVRVLTRAMAEGRFRITFRARRDGRSVLIVGAGEGGRLVLREMLRNPQLGMWPVGFVDDDERKLRTKVDGVRVLGRIGDLGRVIDEAEPDEILIAIPSAPGTLRADVLRASRRRGVPVRTLPTVFELLQAGEGTAVRQVREVRVEDVLGREPVRMELDRVGAYLRDQVVLVTGAGGSIGSELCRQIARVGPARLVLLDHAEDNLFRIERELLDDRQVPPDRLASVIADVKEGDRIREVLAEHRPQVVFHAAAYKHVGLMEENPVEAVRNNSIATRLLTRLCGEAEIERFVLVSTDKAVEPETVMGASKALAELAVEAAAQRWPGTRFSCVRFGNVLGSSGSVVPIFQRQIRLGGPVTVTDERMTRYFMTIPEAVQLVIQAGALGSSGDILVLDMGEPVSILQLARDMIELSGLRPDQDIAIEVVGARPGEKLHEALSNRFERLHPTDAERIRRAERTSFPPEVVEEMFNEIGLLVLEGDRAGVAAKVAELQNAHALHPRPATATSAGAPGGPGTPVGGAPRAAPGDAAGGGGAGRDRGANAYTGPL
ncbi:nucleoside-diphosphate sugar epimerase/dehydratase [Patulibacter brassicae]|jgi:FlaA1/EpsC-like NDP-sugar epimerase|uniref:Nucleoside-diphosphate sugar epimerase/dehydratase n=1 Tax=Patulibacter brassicae TaxID=1705717 RepID=A0ABU4VKT7_9ACTN|nr:nucleoside-diphosphate sugar epimerase/dehydratase [Patulibacter brassicae]MDX8152440.1 nucleoside-diphosphate sugar epimerase/dehydratase [Patulibacter brassicae]